jgi:hypothetical protein
MALSEVDRLTRRFDDTNHIYTPLTPVPPTKAARLGKWIKRVGGRAVSGLRVATAPTLQTAQQQLKDHVFTIAAITCFDWSAFLWNEKAGLITTGIAFILYELKVSSS